jgi:hypothetical protein
MRGIATRGLRHMMRNPVRDWPRKAFNSFSTDFGYRLECNHRDWVPADDGIGYRTANGAQQSIALSTN